MAITINGSGITSSEILDGTLTEADWGGNQLSHRNLIINGAMQVAQRGTSFSWTSSVYTLDRFKVGNGGGFTFDTTITQDTNAPSGFSNSLKITPDTTQTPTGSDNATVFQNLEGQDVQRLAYGTNDAKKITLSFYVKSNKTGTYGVQLQDLDNDLTCVVGYTVDTANTWERKTLTFNENTSNSFDNDNNGSLRICWHLACGSDDLVSEDTSWGISTGGFRSITGQVNFMDNTSNTWQITGLQLEVGSVATPFEHRSYGEELARCQRYYYNSHEDGDFSAYQGQDVAIGVGSSTFGGSVGTISGRQFPTTMRTAPTITLYHQDGTSGAVYTIHNAAKVTGVVGQHITFKGFLFASKSASFNQSYGYYYGYTADAEL